MFLRQLLWLDQRVCDSTRVQTAEWPARGRLRKAQSAQHARRKLQRVCRLHCHKRVHVIGSSKFGSETLFSVASYVVANDIIIICLK
jgi:hypothetical protein